MWECDTAAQNASFRLDPLGPFASVKWPASCGNSAAVNSKYRNILAVSPFIAALGAACGDAAEPISDAFATDAGSKDGSTIAATADDDIADDTSGPNGYDGSIVDYDGGIVPPADASIDATPPVSQPAPKWYYRSERSIAGLVDPNSSTYMYAPAFVYADGEYHYFACVGVSGDWIYHKASATLAGLATAQWHAILSPSPGETHNCDPAAIKGADGNWYVHYSNTPDVTGAGVAVANNVNGPYLKITTNLLGQYSSANLTKGQYGRGQTTVTLGPDNNYYMAFTNQIEPIEPMSIVILKSPDPTFAKTRSEVTRISPSAIGGWSTQLSYDPKTDHFVFIEPSGKNGFNVTSFDRDFKRLGNEVLPLPPNGDEPGEGQAFLTDGDGRLIHESRDAHGTLLIAGATVGPERGGIPKHVTGANQWRAYRVNPVGVVDTVAGAKGVVRVAGWSFDPNDPSVPLSTHIYLNQPGGTAKGTNAGLTDLLRNDVNSSQGSTGNHGFNVTIPTALRGQVDVCVAAINIGTGDNEWIGCKSTTVTD